MSGTAPTGEWLRRTVALLALGSVIALVYAAGAHAARINVQDHEYVIRSGGPATWDATQSPSGHACAGSMTDPVYSPVTDGQTFAGHSWRWDGFDRGVVVLVDGDDYFDTDARVTVKGESIATDPRTMSGLAVSRTDTALRAGPVLRSLIKLKSSSSATHTVTLDSNLGTDGSPTAPTTEGVRDTASGDTTYTKADRWVVSSQPPPIVAYNDPALTHVLFGRSAATKPDAVVQGPGPGSGCLTVDFAVRIPAGKTRYLLFYTEMNPQPGVAASRAARYDHRDLSRALLDGIGRKTRGRIINWDLK
jgi:hypothetical protein